MWGKGGAYPPSPSGTGQSADLISPRSQGEWPEGPRGAFVRPHHKSPLREAERLAPPPWSRGRMAERRFNRTPYAVQVLINIAVLNPQYAPTLSVEKCRSHAVMSPLLRRGVRCSIDLHHEHPLNAGEVRDVRTDRVLPSELGPHRIATEMRPKEHFGFCHRSPELLCPAPRLDLIAPHVVTLSPPVHGGSATKRRPCLPPPAGGVRRSREGGFCMQPPLKPPPRGLRAAPPPQGGGG